VGLSNTLEDPHHPRLNPGAAFPSPVPVLPEFTKVAVRTGIGFVVMGFIGFFVKLIFIPINNIIVGS